MRLDGRVAQGMEIRTPLHPTSIAELRVCSGPARVAGLNWESWKWIECPSTHLSETGGRLWS